MASIAFRSHLTFVIKGVYYQVFHKQNLKTYSLNNYKYLLSVTIFALTANIFNYKKVYIE